ncbi:efflux transporter outer membrane subunit [Caenimonas soli]|uniref:efflux transporter outer membrane subunit n=1 Tax=Caenimonas soli TaxID=2735555 RepID=UPI001555EEB5|nr:efflux transporter outer membrane subunit [Caenimonas soli]NPC55450.1 efflux transporter outer membrane subunit [Caenimonas soli]
MKPLPCILSLLISASVALPALAATPAADARLPAAWHEPLPHGGEIAVLNQWWSQFDDPLLSRLIDAAQGASPNLASATSRIAQAQANRTKAGAALLPSLDGSISASRGRTELGQPLATSTSHGLQMAWEIDLFGGGRAGARAAQARLEAAQAGWHEARVAVAAEVATSYVGLRACEARLVQTEIDVASREETSRLTGLSAQHGLQSPGSAALARASAAQGRAGATAQRAQCASLVKALVALTASDEASLRAELAASTARLPSPAQFAVDSVPARALAQRPDLYGAERDLVAAGAEWTQSKAQSWPRLMLQGNFGGMRAESAMGSTSGSIWSFGPISLVLPIFDGGQRRANTKAAEARYEEAGAAYRAKLRTAVREVEEALVSLRSAAERAEDARAAAGGFRISLQAADARYRGGLASLFELEDARRSDVQAQTALIDLQQERIAAWIALYRALGGGWEPTA